MNISKKDMFFCIGVVGVVCCAQILGNRIILLFSLMTFLLFVCWECLYDFSFPVLLFFLPWSPLLKMNVGSNSFYTFALITVCGICLLKKRFKCRPYQLVLGILLLSVSLVAKLLDGSWIDNSYLLFMMLLVLFPVVKEELNYNKYDFFQCIVFFAVGIIVAALSAKVLVVYSNIAKYIKIDSYQTIVRLSGYYGDPNFYSAHITAALAGCLAIIQNSKSKKNIIMLSILSLLLLYCGMLSGSKSFVLVAGLVFILWIFEVLFMRGRFSMKFMMITGIIAVILYVVFSGRLNGLIGVLITRFSNASNLSNLTTGRTELWASYIETIFYDAKIFLIGKGFTNILVNGRASHNTLLQIIYQFGVIGGTVLTVWIISFFREKRGVVSIHFGQLTNKLILLVGMFLPWFALDVLFFDEFYLIILLAYMGIKYLEVKPVVPK